MPPKASIEEIFDDDTDLPLPPIPLPKQPLYTPELSSSRQVSESTPFPQTQLPPRVPISEQQQTKKENVITDITPYKKYVQLLLHLITLPHWF
jgi:hypothetical protein